MQEPHVPSASAGFCFQHFFFSFLFVCVSVVYSRFFSSSFALRSARRWAKSRRRITSIIDALRDSKKKSNFGKTEYWVSSVVTSSHRFELSNYNCSYSLWNLSSPSIHPVAKSDRPIYHNSRTHSTWIGGSAADWVESFDLLQYGNESGPISNIFATKCVCLCSPIQRTNSFNAMQLKLHRHSATLSRNKKLWPNAEWNTCGPVRFVRWIDLNDSVRLGFAKIGRHNSIGIIFNQRNVYRLPHSKRLSASSTGSHSHICCHRVNVTKYELCVECFFLHFFINKTNRECATQI